MKNEVKLFIVLIYSCLLISCGLNKNEQNFDKRTKIFIESGRIQCQPGSGMSLQDSIKLLETLEIKTYGATCAYQDFAVAAACGYGTNEIYLHIISNNKLSVAKDIGFKSIMYLKNGDDVGYKIAECWNDT